MEERKNIKLSLNKLKALFIELRETNADLLELETPNLQSLDLYSFHDQFYESIKFNYPASIQYLSVYSYKAYFLLFKNVEYLKFESSPDLNRL